MNNAPANQNVLQHKNTSHLPISALLSLALAGFIAILTETLPAGLLVQISTALKISESLAGQLVSVYALGALLSSIPVMIMTRHWNRKRLLLCAITGLLLFNSLTALLSDYAFILLARFLAGACTGVIWGMLASYTRRMVPEHLQGRAIAIAMVGTPLALSFGVPAGTWIGGIFGWRLTFAVTSAITMILIIWIIRRVPSYRGDSKQQPLNFKILLKTPSVLLILLLCLAWVLAHNILYTYIAPLLITAGLQHNIDILLLIFGCSAIAGIWITGVWVDRLLFTLSIASVALFGLCVMVWLLNDQKPFLTTVIIALWGLSFGGAATLIQTAMAKAAKQKTDLAQSMIVSIWNLAIALGGLVGGVILNYSAHPRGLLFAALCLIIVSLIITVLLFKPTQNRQPIVEAC